MTARITDRWDRIKKLREFDLQAVNEFHRLYGDFFSTWKSWDSLHSGSLRGQKNNDLVWQCQNRAAQIDGNIESLLVKVSAERSLTADEVSALAATRQAFQQLRKAIENDRPLNWWAADLAEYSAFKSLATITSCILSATPRGVESPKSVDAARTLRTLTDNDLEETWVEVAVRVAELEEFRTVYRALH